MVVAEQPQPSLMVPIPYQVAAKRRETHDAWTLTLEPRAEALPSFAPGQFAMLYVFGVGEVPISVCRGQRDDGRLAHTIRAVGTVSSALCRL